ncbi:MAG: MMPL family transporter [Sphingobacteriales bacterium]|nr:MMPL family transporter [Sphingobacteriales bacterium]
MWLLLAKLILQNRKSIFILFILATIFWGFQASHVRLAFNPGKILPKTDSTSIRYQEFKNKFGEDETVMVLGVQTPQLFQKDFFNSWVKLSAQLEKLKGVKKVLSLDNFKVLEKDTLHHRFTNRTFFPSKIQNQQQLDSLKTELLQISFYQGLLFNDTQTASIIAVTLDAQVLQTAEKTKIIHQVYESGQAFAKQQNVAVHYSGLPYIKTVLSTLVAKEFGLFLGLSILIAAIILGVFFRSFTSIYFPIIFVLFGVIWSVGFMATLGYEITLLTGVIPPLMVIIGIPNCILIFNKYHTELAKNQDQRTALQITIQKISLTTFIANLTTAIGFGVLYFTNSDVLKEFGLTAACGVMFTWLICLCLLPIICSYLKAPVLRVWKERENKLIHRFLHQLNHQVIHNRKQIYWIVFGLTMIAFVGIAKIKINGFVVDDLPKSNAVYQDLKFFESTFNGVLPLEISIDTRRKNGMMSLSNIQKMDRLEQKLKSYPEFGKAISLSDALKYTTQVFYGNHPQFYRLPNEMEKNFILLYAANAEKNKSVTQGLIDKNRETSSITLQMKDIGSARMNQLLKKLQSEIDSVFNPKKYNVILTGPVILYVKGTNYLVKNLRESLILAIFLIGLIMWILFRGVKMIAISLLPNLIPLLLTAGLMGFLGIPLKPSTILIFSIALGIASDQTIYFLTRFKQEKDKSDNPQKVISETIKETGVSMVYTAIILFFGFGIFAFSTFGGTVALGTLLSVTLVMAMLFNLTFLPALLMSVKDQNNHKSPNKSDSEKLKS